MYLSPWCRLSVALWSRWAGGLSENLNVEQMKQGRWKMGVRDVGALARACHRGKASLPARTVFPPFVVVKCEPPAPFPQFTLL